MEDLELISFQIISNVGAARSSYISAIQAAKAGDFSRAERLLAEGKESFLVGHNAHMKLLERDPAENMGLLVMHAEDQLMSAEGFKLIAQEFIDVYKAMLKK